MSSRSDRIVLVTGAAGGPQGSTGAHLAALLHERGATVRALVHRDDHRAAALRKHGVKLRREDGCGT